MTLPFALFVDMPASRAQTDTAGACADAANTRRPTDL